VLIFNKEGTMLEVGAGKSQVFRGITNKYHSFDTDTDLDVSFHNIFDITETYDYIIANQVAEHIEMHMMTKTIEMWCNLLNPGGIILLTIPNVQYWAKQIGDYDHKHPLFFFHLGAFLELCGDVDVTDVYKYAKRSEEIIKANETEQFLFAFMSKWYDIEPWDFIAVVAKKRNYDDDITLESVLRDATGNKKKMI
jgi:predicted SAM-dependent methyltransferase